MNVPYNYNEVYDVHYFLTSLLDLYISQELFDWIIELYPREVIPEDDDSTSSSTSSSLSSSSRQSSSSSSSSKQSKSKQGESENDKSDDDELVKDLTLSSDSSSDSTRDSTRDSTSDSSSDSTRDPLYISEGRLINGTEDVFKLPSPLDLLKHGFFENFTIKPSDFDENSAIYFKAGF